jgi:hypothetical protein
MAEPITIVPLLIHIDVLNTLENELEVLESLTREILFFLYLPSEWRLSGSLRPGKLSVINYTLKGHQIRLIIHSLRYLEISNMLFTTA